MKVYIARHGQTDLNKNSLLQGRNGLPLNETGIAHAKQLREKLNNINFIKVYSAPHTRTFETAKIATGKTPITDERLDVFDLGSADNLNKKDVKWTEIIPDPAIYTEVEKPADYIKRIYSFMNDLKDKYGQTDENIFICGHKCTTAAISTYLLELPLDNFAENFKNLSLSNGCMKAYDSKTKTEISYTSHQKNNFQ